MRLNIASGIIILALILTIFIAGCTGSQNTSTQSGQSNNAISISAQAVQSPQQFGEFVKPASGDKYVMYNITFTNINAPDRAVNAQSFTVQDTSNHTYAMANFNQEGLVSHAFPFQYVTTQPGTKITGVIVYQVPQDVKLVNMTYDDHEGNHYGSYSHVVISLTGSLNAASSTTGSTSTTPGAQSTSTPSGSPSSNPSLISQPTSSPTSSPTASPTPTPIPTTTKKSVTIYAEPVGVCSYCEAAIAQYKADGWDVTVIREGDPGFVPQASYPGIVITSTGGY
jgi:ABC-type Fe3+-hydroxamate transport system substrate-binding protein